MGRHPAAVVHWQGIGLGTQSQVMTIEKWGMMDRRKRGSECNCSIKQGTDRRDCISA
jgi:hypothetical protein